jgi:hypothetical protein
MAHIKAQNTHSDMVFRCFINPIQPTSKHICDIGWWEDIKSELNNSPNKSSEGTIKKWLIDSLASQTHISYNHFYSFLARLSFVRITFL